MKGAVLAINADGTTDLTRLDDPVVLPHLRRIVGGHIEGVPMFDSVPVGGRVRRCVAFCNEEGKLKGLPVNIAATRLWWHAVGRDPGDMLVGNVAVVWGDEEFMGEL